MRAVEAASDDPAAGASEALGLLWPALGGEPELASRVRFSGEGALRSAYRVTDFAAALVGAAELAVAELVGACAGGAPGVAVDRRLASYGFRSSLRPIGWRPPAIRGPVTGDYEARDGWIRIQANGARHQAATLRLLGAVADHGAVAKAVAGWAKTELECAIVEAGGCASELRTPQAWAEHPQGRAVAAEPLVETRAAGRAPATAWSPGRARPLEGVRVLDLTRLIAGPLATRFLAGYGAEVLRIDPPGWDEPAIVPEVTLGKRCARLDLGAAGGRQALEGLLAQADVLVHSYRPGVMEALGFGETQRRRISPSHVEVTLNAYGWTGPWAGRRGYDSIVQMGAGIAHAEMLRKGGSAPGRLPAPAIDSGAGYLLAAAAVRGLTRRLTTGEATRNRISLARTAKFLTDLGPPSQQAAFEPERPEDLAPEVEQTDWGPARRLRPAAWVEGAPARWDRPASRLGSSEAAWLGAPRS